MWSDCQTQSDVTAEWGLQGTALARGMAWSLPCGHLDRGSGDHAECGTHRGIFVGELTNATTPCLEAQAVASHTWLVDPYLDRTSPRSTIPARALPRLECSVRPGHTQVGFSNTFEDAVVRKLDCMICQLKERSVPTLMVNTVRAAHNGSCLQLPDMKQVRSSNERAPRLLPGALIFNMACSRATCTIMADCNRDCRVSPSR